MRRWYVVVTLSTIEVEYMNMLEAWTCMVVIDITPSYPDGYWFRYGFLDLGYLDRVWSRYSFGVGCVILYSGWSRMFLVPSGYVFNYIAV